MNTNRQNAPEHCLPPGLKLNLGCGPVQPSGWVNIDASNRARLAAGLPWLDKLMTRLGILTPTEFGSHVRVHNLFKPLPYSTDSVSCIYAGELWEHFEYPDAVKLTRECYRTLAPSGVLRVCVPDGVDFWRKYLEIFDREMQKDASARCDEPLNSHIGMYFRDICTQRVMLGSMGHTHKWQYDEVQLIRLFESCGFSAVSRRQLHHSEIPDIALVERSDFLIVEGAKLDRDAINTQ